MVTVTSQQLLLELAEHNDFFDMLVDMIPSKLYIAGNSGDDFNPKYHKGQSKTSKETRRAKAKAGKRRKLNPSQAESTVETKARLENSKKGGVKAQLPQKGSSVAPSPDTPEVTSPATPVTPNQSRIEALRSKLQAKIREKQGDRPSNPDQVSKRAARRAEKLRRQEEAKKRTKSSNTKVGATATTNYKISSDLSSPSQDLAAMDFGRLAGLNANNKDNYQKANKSLANLGKAKNLEKMLADAEAKKQKLEELKKGSEEDQAKAKSMQWSDTFKEADGQRVKDDPSKIKKALKRKVAKKQKSQKAWKTRTDQTTASKDERQKIRTHNLTARKQGGKIGATLSKKRIVDKKEDEGRRLSRAGFEGRKTEFLNGKGGKTGGGGGGGGGKGGGKE